MIVRSLSPGIFSPIRFLPENFFANDSFIRQLFLSDAILPEKFLPSISPILRVLIKFSSPGNKAGVYCFSDPFSVYLYKTIQNSSIGDAGVIEIKVTAGIFWISSLKILAISGYWFGILISITSLSRPISFFVI